MKLIPILLPVALLLSCQENKTTEATSTGDTAVLSTNTIADNPAQPDTVASSPSKVPANKLIVPGKSIGLTHIGQLMEEAVKSLGQPDDGDAAMGKSVSTWYSKNNKGYKTQVFASMQNGKEGDQPRIKSIRVTNPFFETAFGLKPGSNLKDILAQYPGLLLSGNYKSGSSSIRVYDDPALGIAFEADEKDICVGICVHVTGEKAFMQYLPFEDSFTPIDN